jgi:hypothetical protein
MAMFKASALREQLTRRLLEIGVEERAWPGRDDGFASLLFQGKDFGHFHSDCEIDIRLGKDVIARERLIHPPDSSVHPGRARNSPWYEMKVRSAADIDEAARLVRIAVDGIRRQK